MSLSLSGLLPFGTVFSFWPLASGDHLPARSTEDVKLAWIENDGRLLAGLQARRGRFRQHHAERLAAALHRPDRHAAQRLQHGDAGAEALLAPAREADVARPDADHRGFPCFRGG